MSAAQRTRGERLHESRMREICTSGSTRGEGGRRSIVTPDSTLSCVQRFVWCSQLKITAFCAVAAVAGPRAFMFAAVRPSPHLVAIQIEQSNKIELRLRIALIGSER